MILRASFHRDMFYTDRHIDTLTDTLTDRQTDRQRDRHTGGAENDEERITQSFMILRASFHRDVFYTDRHTDTLTDTLTDRQADRQTDRHTD